MLDKAVELIGRSGRIGQLVVRGESMVPTLGCGRAVAVEFSPARWARGDVILFRQADELVVHRIVGKGRRDGRSYFRTRGDGRIYLDPPVDPESVAGRVVALHDGERWRSLRGGAARLYGRCLAWHDYFWAGAAVLARGAERRFAGIRLHLPLTAGVRSIDRTLLRLSHRLLFRRVHRPVSAPGDAATGG